MHHDELADPDAPCNAPREDVLSILIATDNHLGYAEKDPIRGNDSIATFEEILKIAQDRAVDMVLLGGDLFHDNKPSRKTLYSTMELLRAHCMGDRPCALEFLSDQSVNFPNRFATVNYMDPNYNVSMPLFSIHGNHDDPSGDGLAALDLLSVSGLVNYFGRQREVDDILITPVLLRKGITSLALYGLGNVRDERLHRTFLKKKVKMLRPIEGTDDWFNLFVIHQNRVKHDKTNYIPESFLDPCINLVLWGHEHDCNIEPVLNAQQEFYITQPGSSVATSLSEGEAKPKHVAVLRLYKTNFELESIRLRTVRPFVFSELVLSEQPSLRANDMKAAQKLITARIHELIANVKAEWVEQWHTENETQAGSGAGAPAAAAAPEPPLPLVRLRIEYSGFSTFNPQQFGQQFVGQIANPKDVVMFYRKRKTGSAAAAAAAAASAIFDAPETAASRRATQQLQLDGIDEALLGLPDKLDTVRVEDLVTECLKVEEELLVLPEAPLADALRAFVEKQDNDAIKEFIETTLRETRDSAGKVDAPTDDLLVQHIVMEKSQKSQSHNAESSAKYLSQRKATASGADDDADGEAMPAPKTTARGKAASTATTAGRGRGRGRAKTTTATTSRASTAAAKRKRKAATDSDEEEEAEMSPSDADDDDDEEEAPPAKKTRTSTRTPAARTTRATAAAAAAAAPKTTRQTTLNFAPASTPSGDGESSGSQRVLPASFTATTPSTRGRGRGRGKK
ncbi:meiotic recombination [Blastocladiella emersonii ATCC 22665]|nr:meiotic recombination [Blastocladiella emersonii ATCC 22665]